MSHTVLGGQKITGADVREQNGMSDQDPSSSQLLLLNSCSSRDPGHRKCDQELFRSLGVGQDDGGRHRGMGLGSTPQSYVAASNTFRCCRT